jgi:hypothetical protein
MFDKNILKIGVIKTRKENWYQQNLHIIITFFGFFNLIITCFYTLILIINSSVWSPYSLLSLVLMHFVFTTILSFIYSLILKSQQQNNGLNVHNDIESESSVDIPTVLSPNETLSTETANLRDSPPSYNDIGPPPNYEDVVKDLKVSVL